MYSVEKNRARVKRYYVAHPDKHRECCRRYTVRNREKIRERNRVKRIALKTKAFEKLGNKCANSECRWINSDDSIGCTERFCLQIDHVNGGGTVERRLFKNAAKLYNAVLADTTNKYQLLCANCNWLKRYRNREHN